MSNLRDFNEIYELSEGKILSLENEQTRLKHAIVVKEKGEIRDFINKILDIAKFMDEHEIPTVSSGIKYPNTYNDPQRGKFKIKVLDKKVYVCKVRNTCTTPVFEKRYDEVDTKGECLAPEFSGDDIEVFIKGIIRKYDDIMRNLQDEVLDGQKAKIDKLQTENEDLRKILAS